MAFVAPANGHRQIWVRLLAGGASLQLTREEIDHLQPRWTQDSAAIVYFTASAAVPEKEHSGKFRRSVEPRDVS